MVPLAAALVAMPQTVVSSRVPGHSMAQIEIAAAIGLVVGWIVLDRLANIGIPLWGIAVLLVVALLAGPTLVAYASRPLDLRLGPLREDTLALSFVLGGLIRGSTADRRSVASLMALAGALSWLSYDIGFVTDRPLRDLTLYLDAGATALRGASPYISGLVVPTPNGDLPFVYPPLTIPLFELVAALPRALLDALWTAGSIAAVIGGLWLLGVRGRWLLVLLAWPPLALGIAVGNVASFIFLLFAAGFRFGASLIFSGIFKPQSAIPALWLVGERRWRMIAAGMGIAALLALLELVLNGVDEWPGWLSALRYFQESFTAFPSMQGVSLTRDIGSVPALVVAIVAVGLAFLGRGRNGLARFGLASVLASPTLYLHGLSPLLAGALSLGPELLWFVLGLGPWSIGFQSAWLAVTLVGIALLLVSNDDLRLPIDLSPSRADVHPLGRVGQVWPDGAAPNPVVARSAASAAPAER